MLSLHTVTAETKIVLKVGSIFLVVILLLVFFFKGGEIIKNILLPTPPPPPTVLFGKLPKIKFSQNVSDTEFTYTIDTLSGKIPTLPDRLAVYKTVPPEPSILALENAKRTVESAGFPSQPVALSDIKYQWSNSDVPSAQITLDILSYNFDVISEHLAKPDLLLPIGTLRNEQEAINSAQDFLFSITSLPSDIDTEKTKATLLYLDTNGISVASSLSKANIIRVDFYQKDIDKLPIFYSHPPYSNMNFLVSNEASKLRNIVGAQFIHENISTASATYPIKTEEQILDELRTGKAHIAAYTGTDSDISIKNVSLAYYVGDDRQEYIMPIMVFEGKNNFYAYLPVIIDEWYE